MSRLISQVPAFLSYFLPQHLGSRTQAVPSVPPPHQVWTPLRGCLSTRSASMILVYLEPRIPGPRTPGRSGRAPPCAPRALTHPGQPGPSDVCSARASNSNRPPARGRVTWPEPFAPGVGAPFWTPPELPTAVARGLSRQPGDSCACARAPSLPGLQKRRERGRGAGGTSPQTPPLPVSRRRGPHGGRNSPGGRTAVQNCHGPVEEEEGAPQTPGRGLPGPQQRLGGRRVRDPGGR